jgi:outer membrane protein assembly factor BamD
VAADAQYQIGYAWMHASQSGDYDMGAATKAIDAYQDYLVRYPTSDKADQAQENIETLSHRQTQGAYQIAQFYEQSHPPDRRAAFIYYNEVVREDPNSEEAQKAKKRIQELRPIVAAMPGGAGLDGAPLAAQTVASGPAAPGTAPSTDGTAPSGPSDASGASTPGGTPTPDAASPASGAPASSSPASAPVASPPDSTPLPQ